MKDSTSLSQTPRIEGSKSHSDVHVRTSMEDIVSSTISSIIPALIISLAMDCIVSRTSGSFTKLSSDGGLGERWWIMLCVCERVCVRVTRDYS